MYLSICTHFISYLFSSLVVIISFMINAPKFLEFKHIYKNNTLMYWTSEINENPDYVVFNSYYECGVIGNNTKT